MTRDRSSRLASSVMGLQDALTCGHRKTGRANDREPAVFQQIVSGRFRPPTPGGLLELLRHCQMLLQMRQGLGRPFLEVGIIAALGIFLEQIDRLLMRLLLGVVVGLVEVLTILGAQIVEHLLMLVVERGRERRLDLAAINQRFELLRRGLVVLYHPLRKWLGVGVRVFVQREPASLDLKHVADGGCLYEVLCRCRGRRPDGAGSSSLSYRRRMLWL